MKTFTMVKRWGLRSWLNRIFKIKMDASRNSQTNGERSTRKFLTRSGSSALNNSWNLAWSRCLKTITKMSYFSQILQTSQKSSPNSRRTTCPRFMTSKSWLKLMSFCLQSSTKFMRGFRKTTTSRTRRASISKWRLMLQNSFWPF